MISILIVDDHRLVRETWAMVLSRDKRFKVVGTCSDSQEAILMSEKKRPDIVLMDIHMPAGSGIEATRRIRKKSPDTGIIAVSMYNQAVYARKILQMGASGYVTKNSSPEEMMKAVLEVSKGNRFICAEMEERMKETDSDRSANSKIGTLTEREMDVLHLIRRGLSSAEISAKLNIGLKTTESHRHNIMRKLGQKNTPALIYYLNAHMVPL